MEEPPAPSQKIGEHTIIDEGDVIACYYKGPVSLEEIQAVHDILDAALAAHKSVYQMIDFRTVPIPSAEVRRWIANWAQTRSLRAVVSFGASAPLRLIMNLLQNAIRLIKGHAPQTVLLRTEQDARAFIEEDRKQLR